MPEHFHVAAQLSPFQNRHERAEMPHGDTIADAIDALGLDARLRPYCRVTINGTPVPAQWWDKARPKPGATLGIQVVPRGNDPTQSGIPNDVLRLGFMTLFSVAAVAIPPLAGLSGAAAWGVSTGISLVGALAVNALVPPPAAEIDKFSDQGLTGSGNQMLPFGTVPRVYGKMRLYPPHGARPFTTVVGDSNYLTCLFNVGYGPLKIDPASLKIGNTPVTDYDGVEIEIREGWPEDQRRVSRLFPWNVQEEQISKKLEYAAAWSADTVQQHTTAAGVKARELGVDITFPSGLYSATGSDQKGYRVDLEIQYRLSGTQRWLPFVPVVANPSDDTSAVDQSQLYDWLQTMDQHLTDLAFLLENTSAADQVLTPSLQQRLLLACRTLQGRIADAVANGTDQETILASLEANLGFVESAILNFIVQEGASTVDDYVQEYIDELAASFPAIGSLLDMNRYLYEGYGPALSTFPAWIAWQVYRQGLADVFGDPAPGSFAIYDRQQGIVRRGYTWPVGIDGEYDVRIRRTSEGPAEGTTNIAHECFWTAIRAIEHRLPITLPGMASVAFKIKSSEQLQGMIDTFSLEATARLRTYDPEDPEADPVTGWTPVRATRSPAWAVLDVLQGTANPYPIADEEIDLDAFLAWAQALANEPYNYDEEARRTLGRCLDTVVDAETTALALCEDMCAVGRARFEKIDGRYTVVRDIPQTVAHGYFSPTNTISFQEERAYPDRPHAVKITFKDRLSDFQSSEVIAYDDGYNQDGSDGKTAATVFETIDLWGVTDHRQAWADGRYHLAVARLRPSRYTLETDLEFLEVLCGDMVRVQHDVPMFGVASGRIVGTVLNAGLVKSVVLDTPVPMDPHQYPEYAIRVRCQSGEGVYSQVAPAAQAGHYTVLDVYPRPTPEAFPVQKGDLFLFGLAQGRETVELVVKEIRPKANLTAELVLVDHAPQVHDAEWGDIPEYDPHITVPHTVENVAPAKPIVARVATDETALNVLPDGTLEPQICVYLLPFSDSRGGVARPRPTHVQYDIRPSLTGDDAAADPSSSAWTRGPLYPIDPLVVAIRPVQEKLSYDIRLRTVSARGLASEWTYQTGVYVTGKQTPPTPVRELLREGDHILWDYPNAPLDLAGFLVRHAAGVTTDWNVATPAHGGIVTETRFSIAGVTGPRTVLVKAIDTSGILSETAAVIYLDLGDPIPQNVLTDYDHRALGWPGSVDGGVVDAGDLAAQDVATFWHNDDYRFWVGDDAAVFWVPVYRDLEYTVEFDPLTVEVGARLTVAIEAEGSNWRFEYSRDTQAAFWPEDLTQNLWPATLDDFVWPSTQFSLSFPGEITLDAERYQFRVRIAGGVTRGRLKRFTITVDVPDLEELHNDVVVAAGGTRLTLQREYIAVTNIQITLQYDSVNYPNARSVEAADKSAAAGSGAGPLIRVFDGTHNGAAGKVDVRIKGYGYGG